MHLLSPSRINSGYRECVGRREKEQHFAAVGEDSTSEMSSYRKASNPSEALHLPTFSAIRLGFLHHLSQARRGNQHSSSKIADFARRT